MKHLVRILPINFHLKHKRDFLFLSTYGFIYNQNNNYKSMSSGDQNLLEKAKEAAAIAAVNEYVKDGQVLGIGSGSTIEYAIKRLNERVVKEKLKVICVPSSYQALKCVDSYDALTVGYLNKYPKVDVAIDGADEVNKNMDLIKGGGGCLTQEKIVISCASKVVIIADHRKDVESFGTSFHYIPIEVIPMAQRPVKEKIEALYGGKCELRGAVKKAGPVISDNSNFILDWYFPKKEFNWREVNNTITLLPGVVDTGLFIQYAHKAYFGRADGSVTSRTNDKI